MSPADEDDNDTAPVHRSPSHSTPPPPSDTLPLPTPRRSPRTRHQQAAQAPAVPTDYTYQRVMPIGKKQSMTDDDEAFILRAMEFDFPIRYVHRNPKERHSKSRDRYELYKRSTTIRDAMRKGSLMADVWHDFERGFFTVTPDDPAALQRYRDRLISGGARAVVNEDGICTSTDTLQYHTFHEFLRLDYAHFASQTLDELPSDEADLLRHALGGQSLTDFAFSCAARIIYDDPTTYEEAMGSEQRDAWKEAIEEEVRNLIQFQCFEVIPKADAIRHGKLVKCKWVFKTKRKADGSIQRLKARLTAKGFTQVPGSDFDETYASVVSWDTLRILFATAAEYDMDVSVRDIKSAFLQNRLDVPHLYIESPPGVPEWRKTEDGRDAALHVLGSLYGLKQSSMLLQQRIARFFESIGFQRLFMDQSVFRRGGHSTVAAAEEHQANGGLNDECIVCTWVDDLIIFTPRSNPSVREDIHQQLEKELVMSEWTTGDADYILGMHVTRDFEAGTIKLSQPAAIEKLAKRFGLDDSRAAPRVPMQPDSKFSKPADDDVLSPAELNLYQAKVGGALYLSLVSRPDVSFAVGVLTRFMSCAGPLHMKAIDRVISYLFSTRNLGVQFRRGCSRTVPLAFSSRPTSGGGNAKSDVDPLSKDPYNYADADFAGDVGTRRSTNGGCTLLHGGVVSWLSKLQPTKSRSRYT